MIASKVNVISHPLWLGLDLTWDGVGAGGGRRMKKEQKQAHAEKIFVRWVVYTLMEWR